MATLSAFDFSLPSFSIFSNTSRSHGASSNTLQPLFPFNERFSFTCFLSKKKQLGFLDQILDYIEGGPKLRKWYGAPELLSEDANELEEEESPEEKEVRDSVLVTDGDNEIGQMIILSLIVKRVRVKALVKDKRVAMEAFGAYVESMAGDMNDKAFMRKALRGVRALICPNEGFLRNIESWRGIQHVIVLSQLSVYRASTGIQAAMTSSAKKLAEQDEDLARTCGVPYTIVRAGVLKNTPGGVQGFSFNEGDAAKGSLSKEDAAFICVEALEKVPQRGLMFEVANGTEKVLSWENCFATLMESSE